MIQPGIRDRDPLREPGRRPEDLPEPTSPAIVLMRLATPVVAPEETFEDPSTAMSFLFGVDSTKVREFTRLATRPTPYARMAPRAGRYRVLPADGDRRRLGDRRAAGATARQPCAAGRTIMQPLVRSIRRAKARFHFECRATGRATPDGTRVAVVSSFSLSRYTDEDLGLAFNVPDDWTLAVDEALNARRRARRTSCSTPTPPTRKTGTRCPPRPPSASCAST